MRHCPTCNGTGLVYVGTGHRMSGYPLAEQHATDWCPDCDAKEKDRDLGCPIERNARALAEADDLIAVASKQEGFGQ